MTFTALLTVGVLEVVLVGVFLRGSDVREHPGLLADAAMVVLPVALSLLLAARAGGRPDALVCDEEVLKQVAEARECYFLSPTIDIDGVRVLGAGRAYVRRARWTLAASVCVFLLSFWPLGRYVAGALLGGG